MSSPALGGLRAWSVFISAAVIYILAVASRTSFAVAVPQAGARFPGGSSLLAMFVVLQLAVYAAAQVPVGLVLDRFGSRRVLVAGGIVVALGQGLLAIATSVPMAVLARILVGAGDATAFIGVLRLLPAWFPLGRVPLMSQTAALLGGLGQIVSAVPFLTFLHAHGWGPAFTLMSGCALFIALVGLAFIRDTPQHIPARTFIFPITMGRRGTGISATFHQRSADSGTLLPPADEADEASAHHRQPTEESCADQPAQSKARSDATSRAGVSSEPVRVLLGRVVRHPGTWLGYFSHWVCMFPSAVLTLMWGVSWMTEGLGISAAAASAIITANTVAAAVGGLIAGFLSGRMPRMRALMVAAAAVAAVLGWCVGLFGHAPVHAALIGAVILGFTAPFSGIGFDVARSFHTPARWGTCTGVVNTGGFTATIIAVEVVGLVLDATGGGRSAHDFILAIAASGLVWIVGMIGLCLAARATRRYELAGKAHASF